MPLTLQERGREFESRWGQTREEATHCFASIGVSQPVTVCYTDACFPLVCSLRNRGPAGGGRVRSGVQPVEEQGVRVSQLQAVHRRLSLRASPGEVPGDGAEQQPHRQPQVSPSTGTSD